MRYQATSAFASCHAGCVCVLLSLPSNESDHAMHVHITSLYHFSQYLLDLRCGLQIDLQKLVPLCQTKRTAAQLDRNVAYFMSDTLESIKESFWPRCPRSNPLVHHSTPRLNLTMPASGTKPSQIIPNLRSENSCTPPPSPTSFHLKDNVTIELHQKTLVETIKAVQNSSASAGPHAFTTDSCEPSIAETPRERASRLEVKSVVEVYAILPN
jgi:hypothetical protein